MKAGQVAGTKRTSPSSAAVAKPCASAVVALAIRFGVVGGTVKATSRTACGTALPSCAVVSHLWPFGAGDAEATGRTDAALPLKAAVSTSRAA